MGKGGFIPYPDSYTVRVLKTIVERVRRIPLPRWLPWFVKDAIYSDITAYLLRYYDKEREKADEERKADARRENAELDALVHSIVFGEKMTRRGNRPYTPDVPAPWTRKMIREARNLPIYDSYFSPDAQVQIVPGRGDWEGIPSLVFKSRFQTGGVWWERTLIIYPDMTYRHYVGRESQTW